MPVINSAEQQPDEQAAAMLAEVLRLPTDEAQFTNTYVDTQDIGLEFCISGDNLAFQGENVGRVVLTLFFDQSGFYSKGRNLTDPSRLAIGVPSKRNFGPKCETVGSFGIPSDEGEAITAIMPKHPGSGEIVASRDPDHVLAVGALARQLVGVARAATRVR